MQSYGVKKTLIFKAKLKAAQHAIMWRCSDSRQSCNSYCYAKFYIIFNYNIMFIPMKTRDGFGVASQYFQTFTHLCFCKLPIDVYDQMSSISFVKESYVYYMQGVVYMQFGKVNDNVSQEHDYFSKKETQLKLRFVVL